MTIDARRLAPAFLALVALGGCETIHVPEASKYGDANRMTMTAQIVDDLTDTGKTAAIVRAMMPKAHFATVYAKPKGRPLVDTFVTEVSQDTWIYFPWDMGFTYQKPIAEAHAG